MAEMTPERVLQAAEELERFALIDGVPRRAEYVSLVRNDKLYRWHQAMEALLQQPQQAWQEERQRVLEVIDGMVQRGEEVRDDPDPLMMLPLEQIEAGLKALRMLRQRLSEQPQQVVPPGHVVVVVPVELLRRLRSYVAAAIEVGDDEAEDDLAEIDAVLPPEQEEAQGGADG